MKYVVILAACITLTVNAYSQLPENLVLGVKAGLNFPGANLSYSGNKIKGQGILGFHFGGFAELNVARDIFVQPELLFSNFGAKVSGGETKTTLNYLVVPLLVKYKYADFGFYAGPQVGFLTGARLKFEGESRDAKNDIKSTDFSAVAGAEYFLESGFGFNLRYALSMISIAKQKRYKEKHNVLQVGVQYRF